MTTPRPILPRAIVDIAIVIGLVALACLAAISRQS
jgi:hypothetical protein